MRRAPRQTGGCHHLYADDENGLHIDYRAVSAPRIPLRIFTNHAYFNLNGHGSGDVFGHTLQLQASAYTPANAATLPTGEITPVDGTCMDFRAPKPIGRGIHDPLLKPFGGYDTNFCLDGSGLRKIGRGRGRQVRYCDGRGNDA